VGEILKDEENITVKAVFRRKKTKTKWNSRLKIK